MRMDIRHSFRRSKYDYECETIRRGGCTQNLALGSVIKVKVGKKTVPMKTTTHRNKDLIEASANGKKYVCTWSEGEWVANRDLKK